MLLFYYFSLFIEHLSLGLHLPTEEMIGNDGSHCTCMSMSSQLLYSMELSTQIYICS